MKIYSKFLVVSVLGMFLSLALSSFKSMKIEAKDLIGAWEYGPDNNRTVMINTDGVFSVATYNIPEKKFIGSYGGTWRLDGGKLVEKIEWDSVDPEKVGRERILDINLSNNKLSIKQTNQNWNRVDAGKPGALAGAWIISGTYDNDKLNKRNNPFFPRRTMKILSGTRFHWIAYNVETKSFMNAGGGSYTTDAGTYIESIAFFTKTSESVGKKLSFQYSFENGDWRHKGQKSTGGVMDECWSPRERFEK